MSKAGNAVSFLKTTGIGGIVFLLPLIVLGALVGQAAQIVWMVAEVIGGVIEVKTPLGITLLLLIAIAVLLLLCFAAGLLARRSLGRKIHESFEKYLLLLFPRYSIFKDQLSGTLGSGDAQAAMCPVLVSVDGLQRVGFRMELTRDGRHIIYLPGAPDPWTGQVVCVSSGQVEDLDADFGETVALFERLGRGAAPVLGPPDATIPGDSSASSDSM